MSFDRTWAFLRLAVCAILILCVAAFAIVTIHWRLVNDAAQIDYACFLMDHGMAPYKDLVELNMPGIYMVNWSVMHTLGGSALAWRIFDFSLLALAAFAMIAIARPYGWLGGLFGAALFALFHGRDGPAQAGQRDLIIAVLLLCAYAFLFHALRRDRRWPMFFFGASLAAAAAIKPVVVPLAVILLVAAVWRMYRLGRRVGASIAWSVAGAAVSTAAVVGFLAAQGSLRAFGWMVEKALPYYTTLGRQSWFDLLATFMPPTVRTLLLLAVACAILRRAWNWENVMLLGGIAFGVVSYFAQGKGFPYHRYPMLAFIFLWVGIQFVSAIRAPGFARKVAFAGLALGVIFAPIYTAIAARAQWNEDYNRALAADLSHLGGSRLSGRIQCLTTPGDCDTVLLRMNLVQSTGLVYDYFIFGPGDQPAVQRARQEVWQRFSQDPPLVIVVGRGLYGEIANNYSKLAHWPQLNQTLQRDYMLYDERGFAPALCGYRGYRIYIRKPDPRQKHGNGGVFRAALRIH